MNTLRKFQPHRPTAIIHVDWSRGDGGYGGERCPICNFTKLATTTMHPICHSCQIKYEIRDEILDSFIGCRIKIDQDVINWSETPQPMLTGTLNEIPWRASFVMNQKWSAQIQQPVDNARELQRLVAKFLDSLTPVWLERVKTRATKIRRYRFIAAAGATIVTVCYLCYKQAEKTKREKEAVEEVGKPGDEAKE